MVGWRRHIDLIVAKSSRNVVGTVKITRKIIISFYTQGESRDRSEEERRRWQRQHESRCRCRNVIVDVSQRDAELWTESTTVQEQEQTVPHIRHEVVVSLDKNDKRTI